MEEEIKQRTVINTIRQINGAATVVDLTGKKGPKVILSNKGGRRHIKVVFGDQTALLKDYMEMVRIEAAEIQPYPSDRMDICISDSACVYLVERDWNIDKVIVE